MNIQDCGIFVSKIRSKHAVLIIWKQQQELALVTYTDIETTKQFFFQVKVSNLTAVSWLLLIQFSIILEKSESKADKDINNVGGITALFSVKNWQLSRSEILSDTSSPFPTLLLTAGAYKHPFDDCHVLDTHQILQVSLTCDSPTFYEF